MKTCFIVGAGMAGLTAAHELLRSGWNVRLADKGRSPGGRMATRHVGRRCFDHGAQFFTVRDDRFAVRVAEWERLGLVNPWFIDKGHICYRGVHGMKEIPRYLAEGLDIRTSARVARITSGRSVVLETGEEFHADAVLITAPAPQAMTLLEAPPAAIANAFTKIEFDPCFAVLASLEGTSQISLPGYVRPDAGPIEWLADNAAKGISSSAGAITIHATAAFTRRHLNAPHEDIGQMLLGAAEPYLGSPVIDYQVHRWLYSKPVPADLPVAVVDNGFAIAGDAFGGGRVEGAFLSGLTVAELISRS